MANFCLFKADKPLESRNGGLTERIPTETLRKPETENKEIMYSSRKEFVSSRVVFRSAKSSKRSKNPKEPRQIHMPADEYSSTMALFPAPISRSARSLRT